jgi:hypothetical protein
MLSSVPMPADTHLKTVCKPIDDAPPPINETEGKQRRGIITALKYDIFMTNQLGN